jgi:hypothetical protein
MKILIFTDSRGQHTVKGATHMIYGEMLSHLDGIEVEAYYCPFKWTTTLDFLASFSPRKIQEYDLVVLQTGIVDFSPRTQNSVNCELYESSEEGNKQNLALNTRDYSQKIRNCKKQIFDKVFGESSMKEHLRTPMDSFYNGERTNNMYSLDMARLCLIPLLNNIPNLLYINTNRIVKDWNGDYPRDRPSNMSLIHGYCELFSKDINNCIDLSTWNDSEIRQYTTDNLHLTEEGNRFIFNRILEYVKRDEDKVKEYRLTKITPPFWPKSLTIASFSEPEIINNTKRLNILSSYGLNDVPVATLVIGLCLKTDDEHRLLNLLVFLEWIQKYYANIFEIILVEQGEVARFDKNILKNNEKYKFLYNPNDYNRGWGYNVSVKNFVTTPVVVACDVDVLFGKSFLSSVLQCYKGKEFVSPYRNVYYTNEVEAAEIRKTCSFGKLSFDENKLKNPVSITGGVCIFRKDAYLRLGGYEQYVGYSCEDRAFDVAICELADPKSVLIQDEIYVHLWHPLGPKDRKKFDKIYSHLVSNYGCKYYPDLKYDSYIHQYCNHTTVTKLRNLVQYRMQSSGWGNPNLYRSSCIEINGLPQDVLRGVKKKKCDFEDVLFPEEFTNLYDYKSKEIYANTAKASTGLDAFYNKYKGERCVIIGNGPSLNDVDLGKIQNEYTFGVNSLYYKSRENGFVPSFFVVEDSSVMKENIVEIKKYNAQYKFFPTIYKDLHGDEKNTFFFKMNRGFYEKSSPNFCVPRFSTDFSKIAYCGQSVTYINLQLAYFMGFTEVYLVGMDFSYVIPESHSRKGDVLLSDTDDLNHFHKDYFGKGKTWKDPKLDRVLMNYKQAKLSFESCGRTIMNATHGGKLDVFPRIDYNSVFQYDPGSHFLAGSAEYGVLSGEERTSFTKKTKDSILFVPKYGLIKMEADSMEFGFLECVKKIRLRSVKTNNILKELDISIITQRVGFEDLLDFGREKSPYLIDVNPEGGDWTNLGLFTNRPSWFRDRRKNRISSSFDCVSSKVVDDQFVCLFQNERNREMIKIFTERSLTREQGKEYELISPISLGNLKIVGYKLS